MAPPCKLLDAPNEVLLMIFSHLPGKEIQRARRVCSLFRTLIDHPANKTLLIRIGLKRNKACIEQLVEKVIPSQLKKCPTDPPDLLDVLGRVSHHKGLWYDVHSTGTISFIAAYIYAARHPAMLQLQSQGIREFGEIFSEIRAIAELLLDLHLRKYPQLASPMRKGSWTHRKMSVSRTATHIEGELYGSSMSKLRPYGFHFPAPFRWLHRIEYNNPCSPSGLPRPLTPADRTMPPSGNTVFRGRNPTGLLLAFSQEPNEFSDPFNLPHRAAPKYSAECYFAFATKANWARFYRQSRLCGRDGEVCALKALAALEEIWGT